MGATHFPALDVQVWESGTAKVASANFRLASHDKMSIELQWVENGYDFGPMKHTVSDFAAYQESVKQEYAGPNIGWTAWFDYSYQSNYAGFDFCTWNTDPHEFYYTIGEDPPAKPDPTAEVAAPDVEAEECECQWCYDWFWCGFHKSWFCTPSPGARC